MHGGNAVPAVMNGEQQLYTEEENEIVDVQSVQKSCVEKVLLKIGLLKVGH